MPDPARAIVSVSSCCLIVLAVTACTLQNTGLHWFRASAERRAIYEQVFAAATSTLRAKAREESSPWGVILDIDETVLDNSEYQLDQAKRRQRFDPISWANWVNQRRAKATPGSREFIESVRALGGRIVFVTNRSESSCEATRENLQMEALPFDAVFCAPPGIDDKNSRFDAVRDGNASSSLPPLKVLLYVGDNIKDFPKLNQSAPAEPGAFGSIYFVLPNPMYGSWESVPP